MTKNVEINKPFLEQYQKHNDARYVYNIGSRWSGKTFSVLQINIIESLQMKGLKTLVCRKTYASMKNSIFEDYLLVLNTMGIEYRKTVSPLFIEFSNGSSIVFKGSDSPEKTKGLSGFHRLIMEELNEFTEMDFQTFDLSVRGKNHSHKTYMMHNPVPMIPGQQYWFQDLFDPGTLKPGKPIKQEVKGLGLVSSMKTTYKNNAFCPTPVRDRLAGYKHTNPDLYRLWALGEYTQVQGAIYKNWDVVSHIPDGVDFIGYGLDFGFANDPLALLAVWGTNTDLYIKGMIYKTGLINRDLIKEMERLIKDKSARIIADSAEPKSIEEIYRAGYRGVKGVKKRANYKADIINVIKGYTLHILEGDIDLQREISTYSWQQDKEGKALPKPQDGNDHYMDCLSMLMHNYRHNKELSVPEIYLSGV